MKFDIARQPLAPAFLTIAAIAALAMCCDPTTPTAPAATFPGMSLLTPDALFADFQNAFPVWARLLGGLLILFTGILTGRLAVRYNLYKVGSCLPVSLFAIIACGIAPTGHFLTTFSSAALMILSIKNFCRSYCNEYGFDGIFRASAYLSLLMILSPEALPLLLLLPLAVLLFRRTVRETAVALAGLLLPALAWCYFNWGAGGDFFAPLLRQYTLLLDGAPLRFIRTLEPLQLVGASGIALLVLVALQLFLADLYAVSNKPRFILLYNIGMFLLCLPLLFAPAASPTTCALIAIPAALLLPVFFVRITPSFALVLYLSLLALTAATILN